MANNGARPIARPEPPWEISGRRSDWHRGVTDWPRKAALAGESLSCLASPLPFLPGWSVPAGGEAAASVTSVMESEAHLGDTYNVPPVPLPTESVLMVPAAVLKG